MSGDRWKGTYDAWKTEEPPEPYVDDPQCSCTRHQHDKWCRVHGLDPDEEYEKRRERQWDRER